MDPGRDLAAQSAGLMRQIDRIACRQRGLITAAQLDDLGLALSARRWALASRRMTRIRKGVYLLVGVKATWETIVLAAVLAAGPGAVASHITAACLWDLFDGHLRAAVPPGIHLIASSARYHEGVVVHRQRLGDRDRTVRFSVPVTSTARTLFDLSSMVDAAQLGRCTDDALRRGLLEIAHVRWLFDEFGGPGRRRLGPLREVLSERIKGFDPGANEWERRMDDLWDQLGLPPARRQHVIETKGGRYRVDRAVVELRLAVEWVGSEFHGQRGRYSRDRIRISDLVQAGWDVLEVTPNWTPERLERTVLVKVAERQRLLPARTPCD
jgi:very-short-patch-repair endonuclease